MNVHDLPQTLGSAPPANVILFCPAKAPRAREATFEPFLAERAVERLVETYVDPSMRDLAYTVFRADECKPEEIVLEAQTAPFLAERRVVLVRGAEVYNAETRGKRLLLYLESPCDSTLLILVSSKADKRTKFYKLCEKNGIVVECAALGERDVAAWLRSEAEARGRRIEPSAIQEIVRRAGTRLSDVNNALGIVCDYAGEGAVVREEDVIAACADVAEEEIWTLTDAIAASCPRDALGALRKLCDYGKREDEIIGIVNWLLKSAYAVAARDSAQRPVSSFVEKKVAPLAAKLGVGKLRAAFALCTDTHFMIRSTGVDGMLALELLVIKLSAPGRRRKQRS